MRKPEPKKKKFLLVAFLALLSQPLFTSPSDDEHTARHKSTRRHLIQLVRIISPGVSLRFVVLLFERHSPLLRHFFSRKEKKARVQETTPQEKKKKSVRTHIERCCLPIVLRRLDHRPTCILRQTDHTLFINFDRKNKNQGGISRNCPRSCPSSDSRRNYRPTSVTEVYLIILANPRPTRI